MQNNASIQIKRNIDAPLNLLAKWNINSVIKFYILNSYFNKSIHLTNTMMVPLWG